MVIILTKKILFIVFFRTLPTTKPQTTMLIKFTLVISVLVIINFLLLKFSTNKTVKSTKTNKKPIVLNPNITTEQASEKLAPTGS